jgi:hypothetical protein
VSKGNGSFIGCFANLMRILKLRLEKVFNKKGKIKYV